MAGKSFKKIDDSDLENVNGGYLFYDRDWSIQVIDSKGDVVGQSKLKREAVKMARDLGENTTFLKTPEELQRLRETGSPY